MTKSKTTKRALLASMMSLALCCAMLIGSTFAWFTDSVTTGKNTIVAGNLDVELYAKDENGDYTAVSAEQSLFDNDALWEPGHTEVVYLKVANLGTLALKYKLAVTVESETEGTNVNGKTFNLSDYLVFGQVAGTTETTYDTRADAQAAVAGATQGLKDYSKESVLYPAASGNTSEEYVALVVYMPTTVGNEANYKTGTDAPTITLGVTLVATQTPYESDSFGTNYDENATYPVKASELAAAIETANAGDVITVEGTVTEAITIDKELTVQNLTATAPVTVTADNVTLSNANISSTTTALIVASSVTEFTLTDSTISTNTGNSGSHTAISIPINGKVTFTGNTVTNDYNGVEFGIGTSGGNLGDGSVISNNTFENIGNNAISIYNIEENATITIEGNTFKNVSNAIRLSNPNNATATFEIKNNEADTDNMWKNAFVLLQDYSKKDAGTQEFTKFTLNFSGNTVGTSCMYTLVYDDQDGILTTTNQPNVNHI